MDDIIFIRDSDKNEFLISISHIVYVGVQNTVIGRRTLIALDNDMTISLNVDVEQIRGKISKMRRLKEELC